MAQLRKYQLSEVPMMSEWFESLSGFIDDAWDTLSEIDDIGELDQEDFLLVNEMMYDFLCVFTLSSDYPDFFNAPSFVEKQKKAAWMLNQITPDDYFREKIIYFFWEYADFERDACYYELHQTVQNYKIGRNKELSPEVWGRMLADELRKNDTEDDGMEKRILLVCQEDRLLIDLDDEEFYDYFNTFITVENIESFLQLALRFSLLMCETFPNTLKPKFKAWLKGEDYTNPEPEQAQEEKNHGLKLTNEGKEKPKEGIGRPIKLLFEPDKEEEMKDRFIKYMEKKKVVNNFVLTCDSPYEQLNAIVSWLKQLEEDKILAPKFPRASVLRFMQNCGFKYPNEDKTYTNVLARKLKDEKPVRHEKFI